MRNRWITLLDTRSGRLPLCRLDGSPKVGIFRRLQGNDAETPTCKRSVDFADVLKETVAKNGYGNISIKCCPQCGTLILRTQCCCLQCGMIATYQGGGSELTFSAETILEQPSVVVASAARSAQRSGAEAPITPHRTVVKEEVEDDISNIGTPIGNSWPIT